MMRNPRLKIKDLQFARYFLLHEIDLPLNLAKEILESEVEVRHDGEADSIVTRNELTIVSNPSSVTRFLFTVLYAVLSKHVTTDLYRDKLGLGLLHMCKEYVYADFTLQKFNAVPVLVNPNKLPVLSFILHELVEPVVGEIESHPVFFIPCKFTDVCRSIDSLDSLTEQYNLPRASVGYNDFPLILCNTKVHNSAAELSHLTAIALEMSVGTNPGQKIIRDILLRGEFVDHLVQILKTLRGEIDFVTSFLGYFGAFSSLNEEEHDMYKEHQLSAIAKDIFLSKSIKTAAPLSTPQVWKQWTQWSMLMGLIEKQLSPMRGSMWPVQETLKPHEDQLRLIQKQMAEEKGKSQLNFEELLETYRELYKHKHHEPGKIVEYMLKDERVWKN